MIPGSGRFTGEGVGYTPVFLDFLCDSAGKDFARSAGDLGSIPVLGRSSGEGKGDPLQYFGLENYMDYTWVEKGRTWLSNFHFGSSKIVSFISRKN